MQNPFKRILLPGLLLLISTTGAQAGGIDPGAATMVTGSVSYRERIALPADAVILVQLRDVSLQDVAARIISEQIIKPEHSIPIPFALPYKSDDIDERMTYSVFATIRSGDRLLFVTDRSYQVLTRGQSDHVDLVLIKQ